MSLHLTIELSGPPRGKGRGRAVAVPGRGARVYADPKTVKYESQLRYAATQEMAGRAPTEDPIRVVMTVRFPIPLGWSKKKRAAALAGEVLPTVKPDADNSLKLTDALNEVVFRDDKQVVDARVTKRYSDRPGLTIEIRTLPIVSDGEVTRVTQAVALAPADPTRCVGAESLPLFAGAPA